MQSLHVADDVEEGRRAGLGLDGGLDASERLGPDRGEDGVAGEGDVTRSVLAEDLGQIAALVLREECQEIDLVDVHRAGLVGVELDDLGEVAGLHDLARGLLDRRGVVDRKADDDRELAVLFRTNHCHRSVELPLLHAADEALRDLIDDRMVLRGELVLFGLEFFLAGLEERRDDLADLLGEQRRLHKGADRGILRDEPREAVENVVAAISLASGVSALGERTISVTMSATADPR